MTHSLHVMMIERTDIGPKEVAALLGIGARTACRLMAAGEIESMRAGAKLLRTTRANVAEYQRKQFELAQQGPKARQLLQSIACFREIERLGIITPEQTAMLHDFENELAAHQARALTRIA